ncbi:MAG: hypothetical protein ACR2IK_24040, partial [Chloroflexota bacterium]
WVESRAEQTFPGFLRLGGAEQLQILAGMPAPALAADVVSLAKGPRMPSPGSTSSCGDSGLRWRSARSCCRPRS